MEAQRKEKDGWRLPAHSLEQAVLAGLNQFLSKMGQVIDLIQLDDANPGQIRWISLEHGGLPEGRVAQANSDRRKNSITNGGAPVRAC